MKAEVKQKDRKGKARKPNGGRGRTRKPGMTRISAKNQVTLPVKVLRAGAFVVGDELEVEIDDQGRIVISKAKPAGSLIMELAGSLTGIYRPNELELLRRGDREREIALGILIDDDE